MEYTQYDHNRKRSGAQAQTLAHIHKGAYQVAPEIGGGCDEVVVVVVDAYKLPSSPLFVVIALALTRAHTHIMHTEGTIKNQTQLQIFA